MDRFKTGEKISFRLPNGYSIVGEVTLGNERSGTVKQDLEVKTDYPYPGTLMWVPVEAINGRIS